MALIKSIEHKSELKIKVSSKLYQELEHLKEQAKQHNLRIEIDEAVEQHLKKLIKKATEELTRNS